MDRECMELVEQNFRKLSLRGKIIRDKWDLMEWIDDFNSRLRNLESWAGEACKALETMELIRLQLDGIENSISSLYDLVRKIGMAETSGKISELEDSMHELNFRVNELLEDKREVERKVEEIMEDLDKLSIEVRKLEEMIVWSQDRIEQLREDLSEASSKINELHSLPSRIERDEGEVKSILIELSNLRECVEELRTRMRLEL